MEQGARPLSKDHYNFNGPLRSLALNRICDFEGTRREGRIFGKKATPSRNQGWILNKGRRNSSQSLGDDIQPVVQETQRFGGT